VASEVNEAPDAVCESGGSDIAAACGQLRAEATEGRKPVQMGSI
jgi:adenine C2-methylase RlmN of 23S rRNA A2503 and tRNA A37